MLQIQFNRAPDDGWLFHPKHVERLAGNNKILYKSVILLEIFFGISPNFFPPAFNTYSQPAIYKILWGWPLYCQEVTHPSARHLIDAVTTVTIRGTPCYTNLCPDMEIRQEEPSLFTEVGTSASVNEVSVFCRKKMEDRICPRLRGFTFYTLYFVTCTTMLSLAQIIWRQIAGWLNKDGFNTRRQEGNVAQFEVG
jgi:hypothetical protein